MNPLLQTTPRIAFFGTPELVIPILEEMKTSGFMPSVIITTLDKPAGRGLIPAIPPAKIWAIQNNIPVLQPEKLNSKFISELKLSDSDLFIVVAYGKILPKEIIDMPKLGVYNIHYSLLPKYRGATPVESAVLNGDKKTGVSIQKMVFELDSGPIVYEEETIIGESETAPALRGRLNEIGKRMLVQTIPKIINKTITPREQNHSEATFTKKITKENGLIDLNDSGKTNYRKYLAYYGWPGTYFFTKRRNGEFIRVTVKDASFESGKFIIRRVLPDGKREMDYSDFQRGI